ncbi:MAG TPA: S8 family serine peptidase, partial [Longimicrobiaceae bacterium]
LAPALVAGDGYAVVAFKEPGSARALATGQRATVTAGTVRAGLELLQRSGVQVVELLDGVGAARVRIDGATAAALARNPLVDFVEPRQYGQVAAQVTPWGISMVKAPDFWSAYGVTGAGARIEIIDTGHQQGHVDLPYVPSANCSGAYGGCDDGSGVGWHGTHVLGIVTARNNTEGVVGVAPGIAGSDVFMYGACDSSTGSCPTDQVTAGINAGIWNVQVMNMSLSQPYDAAQANAVAQAWANGIVIVAAAGNNGGNTVIYPAAYTNVVGVSGVNQDKTFANPAPCGGSSNYGSHVDLAAPFTAYSTIGVNTYGDLCGTSMATPHVTGVAALLRAQNPGWTNQQVIDTMKARAEDLGAAGRDDFFGYGLVRAYRTAPVSPALSVTVSGDDYLFSGDVGYWHANVTGGNGTYSYQWQFRSAASTTWSNVGTNSPDYSRSAPLRSFYVRVIVTSGGVSATSAQFLVTVDSGNPMCGTVYC